VRGIFRCFERRLQATNFPTKDLRSKRRNAAYILHVVVEKGKGPVQGKGSVQIDLP
jgi:hypothetical protein